ncbi:sensor histidine kinase [Pseudochrobactrum sp. HB0163]|uniref:sensor histidine kinase n=1 Tax=Pseudochrobactrum sp. HB0163 TaxID=3450708 RepID=UPI003F6E150B
MKRHLTQFALALLLPLIVLVGFFLWLLVLQERNYIENQTVDTAQSLTVAIDREVYGLQRTAEIISYSDLLKNGRLDIFRQTIEKMARDLKINIALYNTEAALLLSSDFAGAENWPLVTKEDLDAAAALEQPYVTGVRQAHKDAPFCFTVVYPVRIQGQIRYYLGLSMKVQRITELLLAGGLGQDWLAVVIGRDNRIIARSRGSKLYTGYLLPEELHTIMAGDSGHWDGRILDGERVLGAYQRSSFSGWRVGVGVKRSDFNKPAWMALAYFGFLLAGTLLLTGVLAGIFWRQISAPVHKLAQQAMAMGNGQAVRPLHSGIGELDVVSDALVLADQRNRKKEIRLTEAQLRLQMALDAGRIGIWECDPQTGIVQMDEVTGHMLSAQGRRKADFRRDFLPAVHRRDRARIEAAYTNVIGTGTIMRETFRVYTPVQRKFIWVNGIGRRIYNDEGRPVVLGLVVNVTAERAALEQREVVAQELNHRLKNMFAVIISLMSLSARGWTDVQDYVAQLRQRMMALADAFELTYQKSTALFQHNDRILLNDLLERLMQPYMFSGHNPIEIEGEALTCPLAHVTPMSLVFHELVTNSVKHGALSVPEGQVKIRLSTQDGQMIIEWRECNGPEIVQEPRQRGFGSRLKKMSIEAQMQGSYEDIWNKSGLVCIIRIPLPDMQPESDIQAEGQL